MDYQVVYTDSVPSKLDIEREVFHEMEKSVEVINAEESDRSVKELIKSANGLITSHQTLDEDLISEMDDCQVISRRGIGVDYIDLDAAAKHGIVVTNVPDYCITEVSNHALALILSLQRRIIDANSDVRQGIWDPTAKPIHRLSNQTLGLVAFGDIAQALCQKATTLGMTVITNDPYIDEEYIESYGATNVEFCELLQQSDIVSLHAPLTDDTKEMISDNEFKMMKNSSILINTSRGGLVDQSAAVDALENGVIRGVGFDVLQEEPPSVDEPLLDQDSAIITPHMGFYSIESRKEMRRRSAENVRAVFRGNEPKNIVND